MIFFTNKKFFLLFALLRFNSEMISFESKIFPLKFDYIMRVTMSQSNKKIDTRHTYILIHQQSQLALEAPNVANYTKNSLELGPINENNPNQMWIVEHKEKDRYEIILGFPDVVLTADGRDCTLKKGVGDKKRQYWTLDTSSQGYTKIALAKESSHFLGVENHRIVIKVNPSMMQCDTFEFR